MSGADDATLTVAQLRGIADRLTVELLAEPMDEFGRAGAIGAVKAFIDAIEMVAPIIGGTHG